MTPAPDPGTRTPLGGRIMVQTNGEVLVIEVDPTDDLALSIDGSMFVQLPLEEWVAIATVEQ